MRPLFRGKLSRLQNAKQFLMNTGWIVFDRIFHMLLSLVITSLTAQYLGPERYGLISYGQSFISIFTIVCKLGIDSIIVSEIIKNRNDTGKIVGTTIGLRMISGFLSVGIIAMAVVVLKPGDTLILLITTIQSVSLLFVAFDTIDYWFQSRLWSKYSSLAKSLSYIVVCGWKILLLVQKADVMYFAIATIIDAVGIGVFLLLFYFKAHGERLGFSLRTAKGLLSQSHPFIISSLLITVYTQMDRIMLGSMSGGEAAVGIYTAAMNIANLWVFVPNALIDSARPIIMKHKNEGYEQEYLKRYTQLYAVIIWLSIAAGVFFTVFGNLAVYILYRNEYAQAGGVLMVLIWSRLFSLIGTTRGIWIVCEGYYKYVKYFVGLGALLNLGMNLLLIPVMGPMGAAIATLAAEFVSSTVALLLFKKTRPLLRIICNAFLLKGVWKS